MVYLQSFRMLSETDEDDVLMFDPKFRRTVYSSYYPFGVFRYRKLPEFEFDDITVFCGDNGSGKSTLLNIIAEKLGVERSTPFNRTDFFGDYVKRCDYQIERRIPPQSSIITSDSVFERVLDIRRINDGIDAKREEIAREYIDERSKGTPNVFTGLDDYDRWKRAHDARKRSMTQSQFIRSRLIRNVEERSNGESALSLFVDQIRYEALYLLDEPENSLSPANQLELKAFIEDCAKNMGCQFVISTHSPFLLSLCGARIYDLDSTPPEICDWTSLECVRVWRDFFIEHDNEF